MNTIYTFFTGVMFFFSGLFGGGTQKIETPVVNPIEKVSEIKIEDTSTNVSEIKTEATTTVLVSGMSKYTDTDFGFSFWYPTSWKISEEKSGLFGYREGSFVKTLRISGDDQTLTISEFTSPTLSIAIPAGACGSCHDVTYFFDKNLHLWMVKYPKGMGGDESLASIEKAKIPQPADISKNTMGGLHMFKTGQKESAFIVPLSAKNFLIINDISYTEKCGSSCGPDVKGGAEYLASSILALDKTVATSVGYAEQTKTIQDEAKAYINMNSIGISQLTNNQILNGFNQCDQQFKNGQFDFPGGYQEYSKWELSQRNKNKYVCGMSEGFVETDIVFTDLDSDGINEAIVSGGYSHGNGYGAAVYLFKNVDGDAHVVDTVLFGKEPVKVVSINKNIVTLEVESVMPASTYKENYKFINNKLVK